MIRDDLLKLIKSQYCEYLLDELSHTVIPLGAG